MTRAQLGVDPCTIFGMNAIGSPGSICPDIHGGIVEQGRDALIPPEAVGREVPVPNRVVGRARHDLEALFTSSKLVLGLLSFGDVLTDADQRHRRVRIVADPFSLAMEPPNRAVRANDALLELEGDRAPKASSITRLVASRSSACTRSR